MNHDDDISPARSDEEEDILQRSNKRVRTKELVQEPLLEDMCSSYEEVLKTKKGISLVSWEKITLSREHGVLGIKQIHNVALMAKLGWRLLMDRNSLWNKVITSKYIRGEVEQAKSMKKNNASNI